MSQGTEVANPGRKTLLDDYREEIFQLYSVDKKPLKKVMEKMEEIHGFSAS